MKFLLITLEFPPDKGGVANYLAGICGELKDVVVLKPKQFRFFWPKWIKTIIQVLQIKHSQKIDMIMLSHILPVGYVALIFKKFFNIPYIVFTHGMDVLVPQTSGWKKFWLKNILKNANFVVANSEFTQSAILNLIGDTENKKTKTEIIYPCPNPNIKILEFPKKLSDKKIILSVGRLVERKGFDKVIEAMPEILKEAPNLVYMIIGDGHYKEKLLELKEKNKLGNNVVFISGVNDKELHVYYGMSDIFIMPARKIDGDVEGFGIVYLEAALFGKPSIAGCDGGSPEAVLDNETGFIVDGNNVDEISKSIIKLLKDEDLRKRMGEAARKRVLDEFRWEKQVGKLKKIL